MTWCQFLVFQILGQIVFLFLRFVKRISVNFTFTKFQKNYYVSIISVMTHQNDVTTRRFRFWKDSSLIFFWLEYFLYVQLTIKHAWKIRNPESVRVNWAFSGAWFYCYIYFIQLCFLIKIFRMSFAKVDGEKSTTYLTLRTCFWCVFDKDNRLFLESSEEFNSTLLSQKALSEKRSR